MWLSGAAHAALLVAGLVAFTTEKLPDATEGIPVEVITDNQLSEITRGETTAAGFCAVSPPSTGRSTPVMKAAASLARNSAACATSSGWPTRPSG